MKTKIRSILHGALALCTTALVAGAAVAQDRPVEMRFAHWLPASHPLSKLTFEPWAKAVEAASKGSIKVTLYPAQQLGKAADHYDMARDGIADMAWVSPGYQAQRFPIFAGTELLMLVDAPGPGSAGIDAWYRRHVDREMKDVKFCFAHLHVGTWHAKKPITDPSEIKGLKVRSSNAVVAQMVTMLGGSNVQVPAPDAREALEKGVADALTFPWDTTILFGIDKVAKYHTDMRFYQGSFVWVMNRGWYDKLAAGQKKVLDDHCNNQWAEKAGADWGGSEDAGLKKLEQKAGHTIVKLTPQQLGAWRKAVEPLYTSWVDSVTKGGLNGKAELDALRSELKSRNALY
jgi:TRAP-type C4-dicarboxylate transport system substrate-binding protein